MKRRRLGQSLSVPVLGQGTWQMENNDPGEVERTIHRGLTLGMTHIDTAEMYGAGRVETMLGKILHGARASVFLTSKVLPQNASKTGTIEACERSLRRLQTDHLDLYLLHWPGHHPLTETLAGFEALKSQGKILAYGVSNFDAGELDSFAALAGAENVACNQVLYHLGERAIEHAVLPTANRLGIPIVGYSPFGSGQFPPSTSGAAVLTGIAERTGASPRQIALAFLIRDDIAFAIPKASKSEHVVDNARAATLTLSAEDLAALDKAFPRGPAPTSLPMI